MKVIKATVVQSNGTDKIILQTNLPEATWPYTGNLSIDFNAAQNKGVSFVKEHFGIDAEVIHR